MKKVSFLFVFLITFCRIALSQQASGDSLQVLITSPANVYLGGEYRAEIALVSFLKKPEMKMDVDGQELSIENGKGMYTLRVSGIGHHEVTAHVQFRDSVSGSIKTYLAKTSYEVDLPMGIISASRMNIMYVGIKNPIMVFYPGANANDIIVTCDNADITNDDGNYLVTVKDGKLNTVTVKMTVKNTGGPDRVISKEFKIRALPPLITHVNGQDGGTTPKEALVYWNSIFADFGSSFAFQALIYSIDSFQCFIHSNGEIKKFTITGAQFTPELKAALGNCKKGDIIAFYDIHASSVTAPKATIKSGPIFFVE